MTMCSLRRGETREPSVGGDSGHPLGVASTLTRKGTAPSPKGCDMASHGVELTEGTRSQSTGAGTHRRGAAAAPTLRGAGSNPASEHLPFGAAPPVLDRSQMSGREKEHRGTASSMT